MSILNPLCPNCGEHRPEYFYQRPNNHGYHSWCKTCSKTLNKLKKRENYQFIDRDKENTRQRDLRKKYPLTYILKEIRKKCRNENIEYNLIKEQITIPKFCPVLGIEMIVGHTIKDYSPSIDRINPKGGYTMNNIVIISYRANRLKKDATLEELRLLSI